MNRPPRTFSRAAKNQLIVSRVGTGRIVPLAEVGRPDVGRGGGREQPRAGRDGRRGHCQKGFKFDQNLSAATFDCPINSFAISLRFVFVCGRDKRSG